MELEILEALFLTRSKDLLHLNEWLERTWTLKTHDLSNKIILLTRKLMLFIPVCYSIVDIHEY